MKNKEYSRREYFEQNELNTLHMLPPTEFTIKYTKSCVVGSNYHIYVNTHQYSVPYEYVKKPVNVVYDKTTVEVYDSQHNRIAIHKRSFKRYGYTTNHDHMPPNHLAYEYEKGKKNAAYYLYRASKIDQATVDVLKLVIRNAACVEQSYKSCEAILQLYKVDETGFKEACKYVLKHLKVANSGIIKSIMTNRTYLKENSKQDEFEQPIHDNLRGKDAFNN